MPETFTPLLWRNNQTPALNETNLNSVMTGIEVIDDRVATLELGVVSPVVVPFATSVTLNATQGGLFRCMATGDITLDDIVGGTDGQTLVFEVQASGAARMLSFTGSTASIEIAVGQWWVGQFRYVTEDNVWLLTDGSGGGSSGGGNELNILAPQAVPYAATITVNAATGALFRVTAVGDLTLAAPINGTDGQAVIVEVIASGGQRTVSLGTGITGLGAAAVAIPDGARWTATLRYHAGDGVWLLATGGSASGSSGVSSVNSLVGVVVLDADDLADGTTNVMMTTAERTKLTGVATGATANSTDAQLRSRATHTGTQPVSSLSTTGTASATTFLRGDSVFADPTLLAAPVHAVGSSGSALTVDASAAAGWVKTITLTANCTLTLTGAAAGRATTLELVLTQDATGGRTVTWPTAVKWPNDEAPILSAAAGAIDRVVLISYNAGVSWLADLVGLNYA